MAQTAISPSTVISNVVLKLKTFLTNNLTAGTVYTAYPERAVDYPIVILTHAGLHDEHISFGSEYKRMFITIRIEVWSKSTKERNDIWDDIYDEMRHHFLTADANGDSISGLGLSNPIIVSCVDIDTESPRGRGHIHRKIAEIMFEFYATS